MKHRIALLIGILVCMAGLMQSPQAQTTPTGELVYAMHVTLSPSWFDPAETPAQITPFGILYALHDALVRPLPGERMGPALAESWNESPDGLTYTFKLRSGLQFHNGDPCTAEDVIFSFTRYKGVGAAEFRSKVKNVEVVDARTVRFHLHQPWPDFMTFYGTTATAAGIVVPKKYLEQVGEDGFKKHPIGLGPYKFVSHTPGIELVLDAYAAYWRHPPYIQRITMKGVPEPTTRLAMLKRGEADIAVALQGFAADCGYSGPPFRWDEARRFLLRCELDTAYFHLYGIGRDDVDYILETFPIVKRKDEQAHGEYRTKRVILDIYDAMQQAMETGTPYHTRLDPPPAHGWTPPEITLETVIERQGDGAKEDTAANSLDDLQRRAAISEIQPKLHFASED